MSQRFWTPRLALLLLIATALAGCTPITSDPGGGFTNAHRNMQTYHNNVRQQNGLLPLRLDDRLNQIATDQALYIAQQQTLTHQDRFGGDVRDRADSVGYNWRVVGENLGVGSSAAAVFDAWLRSGANSENIFDPRYDDMGIGRVTDGFDEWWVVVYGTL